MILEKKKNKKEVCGKNLKANKKHNVLISILEKNFVSKHLKLNVIPHSEIDFVNIKVNTDTKLFIDPCLIDVNKDLWSKQAQKTIKSYFDMFYSLYRNHESIRKKLEFFEHVHEINATKLGYGNGRNGKAKTPHGMLKTFRSLDDLLNRKLNLNHPIDLAVLIEDFAEDCLSDILTNVLFKVLNEFTLEQCRKYGIKQQKPKKPYYFWDCEHNQWSNYNGNCLVIDGEVILLVPKNFVRSGYYYNTNQYFSMIVLEKIKEEQSWIDDKGNKQTPTKKSLKEKMIRGNRDLRLASIEQTEIDPKLLQDYHKLIPTFYRDKGMDDESLDKLLYGKNFKIS